MTRLQLFGYGMTLSWKGRQGSVRADIMPYPNKDVRCMVAQILDRIWEFQVRIGGKLKKSLACAVFSVPVGLFCFGSAYAATEIDEVEKNVQQLKEDVFRSKATMALLKEIMVQGSATQSRLILRHENRLGRGYDIESVSYSLDSNKIVSKPAGDVSTGSDSVTNLNEWSDVTVYDKELQAKEYKLEVELGLKGTGYGIFTYVQQYKFVVSKRLEFTIEEGKTCQANVVAKPRFWVEETNDRGKKTKHISSYVERPNVFIDWEGCIDGTANQEEEGS